MGDPKTLAAASAIYLALGLAYAWVSLRAWAKKHPDEDLTPGLAGCCGLGMVAAWPAGLLFDLAAGFGMAAAGRKSRG